MTESYSWDESVDDLEAIVLAAGQYVGASEDLRPRVLEAARQQSSEQSARRRIRRGVLVVALIALFVPELRSGWIEPQSRWGSIEQSESEASRAFTPAADSHDWRIIEAFTKLRREQALFLRFAS